MNPSAAWSTVVIQHPHSVLSTQVTPSNSKPTVDNAGPFQLNFLTSQVRVYAGCRGRYSQVQDGKPLPAPLMDIILVRKDRHLY